MRKRLFEIIETSERNDTASSAYDIVMFVSIIISILPLAFKHPSYIFIITNIVTAALFAVDYILRLITADYKMNQKGIAPFIKYPFTPWAIIDLLSILPAITVLSGGFKLLRLFRLIRTFRVFRVFKAFRYSKSFKIIISVIQDSKDALLAVCALAIGYILISALVIFNIEPDSFNSFFDAVYWATISLATIGYGDIYPVTTAGRIITMISSFFGIAVVALPAGIITARYVEALHKEDNT